MGLDNPTHIALLVVVLLLVFGAKRIPEIARSLGSGMREFKESVSGSSPRETLTPPAATAEPAPAAEAKPAPTTPDPT